jgi:hypothetical protein
MHITELPDRELMCDGGCRPGAPRGRDPEASRAEAVWMTWYLAPSATPAGVSRAVMAQPCPTPPIRWTAERCRDRADEDVPFEAGQIEPGDADGDRECGPAQQMETR